LINLVGLKINYRSDIDGLRAIAVLAVVFFHAFPEMMPGGFIGVDIFFVISGFLISGILFQGLKSQNFSYSEFYARRIRRIFPALIIVLLSSYIFGWFVLLADEYSLLGKHIAAGAAFASNFFFWQEVGYFDLSADTKPLLHLWSLGIEEQFYLIWPFILWLAYRLRFNLLLTTVIIAIASFILNILTLTVSHNLVAGFYSPQTRFWELLLGAILVYLLQNNKSHLNQSWGGEKANNYVSGSGLSLIILGLILIQPTYAFPGWWALLPTCGALLIIAAGPHAWLNRTFLANRWLVKLGLISYPLYLWHWAVLSFLLILNGEKAPWTYRIIALLVSFLLAIVTFLFIEKPIRFGNRRRKLSTILLLVIMVILGFIGGNTYLRDGLGFRQVAKAFNQSFENRLQIKTACDPALNITIQGYCNPFDGINEASVLLIGDSFAYALSPALQLLRAQTGKKVTQVGKGSCPLLSGYGVNDCLKDGAHVNQVLASKDNIKTVIMTTNYVFYAENADQAIWNEKNFAKDNFLVSLDNTINSHLQKNREVIIFLTIPHGIDPKSCVIRPFSLSKKKCIAPMRTDIAAANLFLGEHLRMKFPTITIIDPSPSFCENGQCRASNRKDRTYYFDGWHINQFGAELLFNQYLANLKAIKKD
jgi:peptidoglycan/LPS O-acetylase OafA/YrhL